MVRKSVQEVITFTRVTGYEVWVQEWVGNLGLKHRQNPQQEWLGEESLWSVLGFICFILFWSLLMTLFVLNPAQLQK